VQKTYGIKARCYWEHPWEHVGNKEKMKKEKEIKAL
jgi:hypothetical protein